MGDLHEPEASAEERWQAQRTDVGDRDPADLHPLCPRCRSRLIVIPARPRAGYGEGLERRGPTPSRTHCDGCGWRPQDLEQGEGP